MDHGTTALVKPTVETHQCQVNQIINSPNHQLNCDNVSTARTQEGTILYKVHCDVRDITKLLGECAEDLIAEARINLQITNKFLRFQI